MFNQLAEIQTSFDALKERVSSLIAYESSGLQKTLDSFQRTLDRSKGVKQRNATVKSLKRALDSALIQVEFWLKSEQNGLIVSDQSIKDLHSKLSRTKQLLTVRKVNQQEIETEHKHANDAIEISRMAQETASMSDFTDTSMRSFGLLDETQSSIGSVPESPQILDDDDFDANDSSFYGTAFLDAMTTGKGVTGFYEEAKRQSKSSEVTALKIENTKLQVKLNAVQVENIALTEEKTELIADITHELDEGTKLSEEVTLLKKDLETQQERVNVLTSENLSLFENLAKENCRYLALDAEAKVARDVSAQSEASAVFAFSNLDTTQLELAKMRQLNRV